MMDTVLNIASLILSTYEEPAIPGNLALRDVAPGNVIPGNVTRGNWH